MKARFNFVVLLSLK